MPALAAALQPTDRRYFFLTSSYLDWTVVGTEALVSVAEHGIATIDHFSTACFEAVANLAVATWNCTDRIAIARACHIGPRVYSLPLFLVDRN